MENALVLFSGGRESATCLACDLRASGRERHRSGA